MKSIASCFLFFLSSTLLGASQIESYSSKYVTVKLDGQLGNQLFQIATAYAYSLDNNIPLTIPDLVGKKDKDVPHNAKHIFLGRIAYEEPTLKPVLNWHEKNYNYGKIPRALRIHLSGYFTSEKYFKHRRNELLTLFAAPEDLNEEIISQYPFLVSDSLVVGVQIRDYRQEFPAGDYHPTMQRSYYEKAMAYFPENAIFVVSSNNKQFAKECTEGIRKNIIYLNDDYIKEFYTLILCKAFIISNSTFGWWASWLSTSPNKVVITPSPWFSLPYDNQAMRKDLLPPEYLVIEN